jgi:hypothetical protein
MITYEECCWIIDEFKKHFPNILMGRNVHRLVVNATDDQPVLELYVTLKVDKSLLRTDEVMVKSFSYVFQGINKTIGSRVVERPIAQLQRDLTFDESDQDTETAKLVDQAHAGDSASNIDSANGAYGTCGWILYLNNVLVCVSNFHILCGMGNSTPLGRRVIINGRNIAGLYLFQPINFSGSNTWDYALARFDNAADVSDVMRSCEDGSFYTYPQQLTPALTFNDVYHKVGARSPICRTGRLIGVGLVHIGPYLGGLYAWFDRQLIFSKMSDGGDSGAMIIRTSDNTVTGLNFAHDSEQTIANPFFLNNWHYMGSIRHRNGAEFPMFQDDSPLDSVVEDRVRFQVGPTTVHLDETVFRDIPTLTAGKLFIGVALGFVHWNGNIPSFVRWYKPPPAPIRPNITVDAIIGGPAFGYVQGETQLCNFLCFG